MKEIDEIEDLDELDIEGVDAEWRVRFGCTLPPLSTEAETLYDVEIEDQGIYCRFLSCDSRYSMDIYDRSNGQSLVTLSYIPGSNLVEASECEDYSSASLWSYGHKLHLRR